MFEAGISWDQTLIMPLMDSLAILETYLDRKAIEQYKQSELVWASLAPHTKDKLSPPKQPELLG
ncbi:MAG: hypothetical protein LBB40_01720 [Holophagales bacterium]|jgi:hypothetical protein|nr:hypothetical protein [Holophagales bacterium]